MGDSDARPLVSVQPVQWPRPKGYANGWRVPAGRDILFVAGQIGWNAEERIESDDFVDQFEQALRNCVAVVESAGGSASDIVRFTMFCIDTQVYADRIKDVGESYRRVMGRHFPVMSLLKVAGLLQEGAQIEIEATAALQPDCGVDEAGTSDA
jgi:enamine deaminase RidA (YjgF/YER057c/UK114 family)